MLADAAHTLEPIMLKVGLNAWHLFWASDIEQVPQPLRDVLFERKDRLYIGCEDVCGDPTCGYAEVIMNGKYARCPRCASIKNLSNSDTSRYHRWGFKLDAFFAAIQQALGLTVQEVQTLEGFKVLGSIQPHSAAVSQHLVIGYTTARWLESSALTLAGLELALGGRPTVVITDRPATTGAIPMAWRVYPIARFGDIALDSLRP